jgi:hypothetical protein
VSPHDLTTEQAKRIGAVVGRYLHYLGRLRERMQRRDSPMMMTRLISRVVSLTQIEGISAEEDRAGLVIVLHENVYALPSLDTLEKVHVDFDILALGRFVPRYRSSSSSDSGRTAQQFD